MKKKPKKKTPEFGLKFQIEQAKKNIKAWPKWMKELARFEGVDKLP